MNPHPDPELPEGIELITTPEPALWALERMRDDPKARYILWEYMPSGFDCYVRVLHPLRDRGGQDPPLRWRDVAVSESLPIAPDAGLRQVTGRKQLDYPWLDEYGPLPGSLSERALTALLDVLRIHTSDVGNLWMAVWDGWGGTWSRFAARRNVLARPLGRRYVLLRGSIEVATSFAGNTPQLWWPDDRAWFVSTEIDGFSTYVGCSADLATSLVASKALEVIEVSLDVKLDPEVW